MNGALIKGIAFHCVTHVRDLNCFFLVFPPPKKSAFAIVLAELWKKDEDEDDSYSSSAVNPTALKSQVKR